MTGEVAHVVWGRGGVLAEQERDSVVVVAEVLFSFSFFSTSEPGHLCVLFPCCSRPSSLAGLGGDGGTMPSKLVPSSREGKRGGPPILVCLVHC